LGHPDEIRRFLIWDGMSSFQVCANPPCPPNPRAQAWATVEAGLVDGCDGSQFPPHLDEGSRPMIWDSSSGRRISLVFSQETSYKGIDTYKYVIPPSYMENATTNPYNSVYFQFSANGLYNATNIAAKTPAFLSKPRMMGVDQSLRDAVIIQNISIPLVDGGRTFQDIEPRSGIPMHAVAQSQFNVAIGPLPGIIMEDAPSTTWFGNVSSTLMPIFWVMQEAGIGDADADQFKNDFYGVLFLVDFFQIGGYVMFGLLLLISLAMIFFGTHQHRHHRYNSEKQTLLSSDATTAKVRDTSSEYGEEEGAIDISRKGTDT